MGRSLLQRETTNEQIVGLQLELDSTPHNGLE